MKYNIPLRLFLLTASAFLVMLLLLYCDRKNFEAGKPAFQRNYEQTPAKTNRQFLLSFDAGQILDIVNSDTLILGSKDGKKLYWVDTKNNKALEFEPENKEMITAAWYNRNQLYVFNGNGRSLLRKEAFPNASATDTIQRLSFNATKALPLQGDRLLVRKVDVNGRDCRMAIYNATLNNYAEDTWSKKDVNCDCLNTDGVFAYGDKGSIFYVNYYNSRILKFDSSFNNREEFTTIDKRKSLPAVRFDSVTKTHRFYSPNRVVNAYAAADNERLYVLSFATASNDLNTVFANNTPLDVYSTHDGEYTGSYHLEGVGIEDVVDMKEGNGYVYLLMKNEKILIYKFDSIYAHNK